MSALHALNLTWPDAVFFSILAICAAAVLIAVFGDPDWFRRD